CGLKRIGDCVVEAEGRTLPAGLIPRARAERLPGRNEERFVEPHVDGVLGNAEAVGLGGSDETCSAVEIAVDACQGGETEEPRARVRTVDGLSAELQLFAERVSSHPEVAA